MTQNLTILGSTGTIGVNTLDVVSRHPERYQVFALTGHGQIEALAGQCRRFLPQYAVVPDQERANRLAALLAGLDIRILTGVNGLEQVAADPAVDSVMCAIVGAAGLAPALAAARAGKRILLANKETLVMAGHLFMQAIADGGATLLPIDSEHNAIFQSLPANYRGEPHLSGVRKIWLTASGGPFRNRPVEELAAVTPEEACAHPNWVMGRKISVDSATMMNKGLEVIEARWLFDVAAEQIEVVIHPQSVIHSMVDYLDGSVIAELGNPDMRTPIAHALAWPERIASGVSPLELVGKSLTFEQPDLQRFPCLALAFEALAAGGMFATALNAANEESVAAFLDRRIRFDQIATVNAEVMRRAARTPARDLDDLIEADRLARQQASDRIVSLSRPI